MTAMPVEVGFRPASRPRMPRTQAARTSRPSVRTSVRLTRRGRVVVLLALVTLIVDHGPEGQTFNAHFLQLPPGADVGTVASAAVHTSALVVRPHQELLFISQEGMVQRTSVRGIRQTGRAAQGVTLMNVRDEDRVSAVALVVESDGGTAANVTEADVAAGPVELSADSGETEGVVGGADLTDGAEEIPDFTDGAAGGEGADGNDRDPDADIG